MQRLRAGSRMLAGRSRARKGRPPVDAATAAGRAELPFDDVALESRLVWMMGSPRTGTTWLLRMLVHPWILADGDPTGIKRPMRAGGDLPAVVPLDETYLLHHMTPLKPMFVEPETVPDPAELLLNSTRSEHPAYFFSEAFRDAWAPELRRLILVRLWSQVALAEREHGFSDPLVLIKEPNGSHGAGPLMSALPRAKLLFVIRDGRDVVDSLIDARGAWGSASESRNLAQAAERLSFVRGQCWNWLNWTTAVQRAYEAHPENLRFALRYEELRSEPERTLGPLLAWLGLDAGEEHLRDAVEANAFENLPKLMKGSGTPRRAASPGLWRQNTTPEEQAAMHEIMGPKLAELGYESG